MGMRSIPKGDGGYVKVEAAPEPNEKGTRRERRARGKTPKVKRVSKRVKKATKKRR